jgi:hypothetical protein
MPNDPYAGIKVKVIGIIKADGDLIAMASGTGKLKGYLYFFNVALGSVQWVVQSDPNIPQEGDVAFIEEWFLAIPAKGLLQIINPIICGPTGE